LPLTLLNFLEIYKKIISKQQCCSFYSYKLIASIKGKIGSGSKVNFQSSNSKYSSLYEIEKAIQKWAQNPPFSPVIKSKI
jgi:hypothetical protein